MTINYIRYNIIKEVANLTINNFGNNLINEVANLTINDPGRDSNKAIASDVKVQYTSDPNRIPHQNLSRSCLIWTRKEEVTVLVPPMEPIIVANNQPDITNRTGVIQTPQALKTPTMQELIVHTTLYKQRRKKDSSENYQYMYLWVYPRCQWHRK